MPEPAACRAHRAASAPGLCAARPPSARPAPPHPAPPRPVHCSPRAEAGQAAARRGSERRGGAGSQGPAEESGGPRRLPEGRPRVDAAGAGSLEQPAPSLPPGALWLEGKSQEDAGQAARAQAGSVERRRELEGLRGWDQKFVRPLWRSSVQGPTCPDLPNSPSGRFPGGEGNIGGCPLSHPLSILRAARCESSLRTQASSAVQPPRSAESEPRGAAASQGGRLPDHLGRALFARHQSWGAPVRAARVPIALEGKGLFSATLRLCDLRLFSF